MEQMILVEYERNINVSLSKLADDGWVAKQIDTVYNEGMYQVAITVLLEREKPYSEPLS